MNKKITKLLSVFIIASAIGTGTFVGLAGCSNNDPVHEHTAATTWEKDANKHWHNCTDNDGAKLNEGDHVYDNDQDTTCNTCGYERQVTPPATATVTGVTASASKTEATAGETIELTATVSGTGDYNKTVTWAITEGADKATLAGDTLTVNKAGTVKVQATSVGDPTKKSAEIAITVTEAELDLAVEISGPTTVAEGGQITLTATVTGVPAGGDTGVNWSVDDETVATISAAGVLTTLKPGSVTVTAKAKADETFEATYDVIVTAATRYDQLANRTDNLVAENFTTYTEGQELTQFTDWGTKGVYEKTGAKGGKAVVTGGQAKGLNTSKQDNISVMVDFGAVEGVVEGYFKYQFLKTGNAVGKKANSVNFYNGDTKVFTLITDYTNYVIENVPGVATQPTTTFTCDVNAMVELNFKFDLANKKVTLKLNDTTVCEELACDINAVTGFEVVTSDGGQRGIIVDDIAVCGTELTVATYKTRVNAEVASLETTYGFAGPGYGSIKGSYEAAIETATTFSAVDAAYSDLYNGMLGMLKSKAELYVNDLWTTGYTHDATKVTALKTAIAAEIEAMTKLADVAAVVDNDFADRAAAAGIHDDAYYAAVDVTVVIYEKGTTTSVVKAGANLTEKAGQSFTLAQLKDAITVPSGKEIKGIYSDSACTTEITESLTLDANGATTATTMTIYVEFKTAAAVMSWRYDVNNPTIGADNPDYAIAADATSVNIIDNALMTADLLDGAKSGYNRDNSDPKVFPTKITDSSNAPVAAAANTMSGEAIKFTNALALNTKTDTTNKDYIQITAKKAITVYVYMNLSDDKHGSNKSGFITNTVNSTAGDDIAVSARKNVSVVKVTLAAGDILKVGAKHASDGSSVRVWFYGIEAVEA